MTHRAGTVAIVGRPNVGKSTLLNALVGTKVAIVTPKPQTTRTRVVGIRTTPAGQAVFVDTPGIHAARSTLNRRMVETARRTLEDVEAVLWVLDAGAGITAGDRDLARELAASRLPVVVVLNKMDRLPRAQLLPLMAELATLLPGRELVPASARRGENVAAVLDVVLGVLPEGPPLHPEDEFTTEPVRALAQELVREQIFLSTRDEVPYGSATLIERFEERPEQGLTVIGATILVTRPSHKAIVIGTGGERLREIGTLARQGLERLLGTRVFLELFVRVEPGWSDNPRRLAELGL
ncbi:MAG TPA: GTPase Era [Candidatus Binatia bacterium]|nr:GTPase Era [Candidatus Binatia bacterium]